MKICADLTSINVFLRGAVQFVAKQKDQKTTDAIANAQSELGRRFEQSCSVPAFLVWGMGLWTMSSIVLYCGLLFVLRGHNLVL